MTAVAAAVRGTALVKPNEGSIRLVAGMGVEGQQPPIMARRVKHRSRVARDPTQPNLRQVHLVHAELHDELREAGFTVAPGQMGENVTTSGVDLLRLATGTGSVSAPAPSSRSPGCATLRSLDKIHGG